MGEPTEYVVDYLKVCLGLSDSTAQTSLGYSRETTGLEAPFCEAEKKCGAE
jgi:hypothetical protein